MKTYFKRVFIGTAMLVLLMALMVPAIPASSFADEGETIYRDPNKTDSLQPVYEPPTEPKPEPQEEPAAETQSDPQTTPVEEPSAEIPDEKEEAQFSETPEQDIDSQKKNPKSKGNGIWHRPAKKVK